jgi:DNA-binding FadR family transcriptional regulator
MEGSTPAVIERRLMLRILRGEYPPGSRLPTVRRLASRFRVNQATIQRVIARLQTRGLIRARQGSGLSVNDTMDGDLALLPYWIEATLDDPARAARYLDGGLEVRRVIAARLIARSRARLLAHLGEVAGEAGAVARAMRDGPDAFAAADVSFTRRMLVAMGNPIALAFFNSIVKVIEEVPLVARAMYAEPETNLASMIAVVSAVQAGGDGVGEAVEAAMERVDRATVARFEQLLVARKEDA